jgi:NAD(P)-dependent dehydrogenase (short-subunit alcohol dehydrogenase family)
MKAVVIGASSGLGRCIGVGLSQRGADVALLARREDRLANAVAETGGKAHAIRCDVTDPESCTAAVEAAADQLGGIDSFVYAAGVGHLARLAETSAETWHNSFATNVIGAALTTSAALPALTEAKGNAVYLSSISASQTSPWPGLASYITSKAALERLVECFRVEHPAVGFTRISVGDCAGGDGESMTEFPNKWDSDLAVELGTMWFEKGYITGTLLPVEELIRIVDQVLRNDPGTSIPSMVVTPRPPV